MRGFGVNGHVGLGSLRDSGRCSQRLDRRCGGLSREAVIKAGGDRKQCAYENRAEEQVTHVLDIDLLFVDFTPFDRVPDDAFDVGPAWADEL